MSCRDGALIWGAIGANVSTKTGPLTRFYVDGVRFSGSLMLGVAVRDGADCEAQPLQRLPEGCSRDDGVSSRSEYIRCEPS